ncbi:acetyl-CoA carboxylase biotin carboxylase subunit [Hippea maritima]|uniref:Biotin carboxylase n=1 Tax=Hippea maritima (strain ATCC 700847 / DSM 10411 / MH2) TaxID=760142 RepID=F2LV89_HIPMA|nr:acetyl-CoA carboxylase biotin carboxylase subunit [Hippea maritima]AEA33673.1 acetyl-CoA carboxylase, biotin carboxylase [Hippea maritima DSM 10411]
MFKKILIANRGEIAVRIIRAAKELGIKTTAVYSTEDKDSMHVKLADEAICIGPAEASKSYLHLFNMAQAIVNSKCDAVHPGYGFLSENPAFVRVCNDLGVTFIGPDAETMERLADKSIVKSILEDNGIPTIPGSRGSIKDEETLIETAEKIGYPVLLKAAWGGGGKGMRVVRSKEELIGAYSAAKMEARASFGKEDIYLEKFIEHPRHIEVQILADEYGNVVHVGERDCTLQRRHQKLLEEAPSVVLKEEIRKNLLSTAVEAARVLNYKNAGTLEFLFDGENFYFIEINTRIQVEHPVTEMAYGVDLIKEQIRIAAKEEISFTQSAVKPKFHVIECRINAEDPVKFYPSPGNITSLFIPGGPGVRVDTAIKCGSNISPFYDSMIAKLIVRGNSREEARLRMLRCLDEFVVEGVKTSIDFFKKLLITEDFINNNYDTNFIDKKILSKY